MTHLNGRSTRSALIGLALFVAGSVEAAPRPKAQPAMLEGTWRQVSGEFEGKDMSAAGRTSRNHWIITATKIQIVTDGGQDRGSWTYRTDSADIDLTTSAGGKQVTYPSIFEVDGDTLTVCIQNFPERGRPKAMEAKAGTGVVKYVYRRVKPGDEKAPLRD